MCYCLEQALKPNRSTELLPTRACCILVVQYYTHTWVIRTRKLQALRSTRRHWRIMLEKVADSARKAVKLARNHTNLMAGNSSNSAPFLYPHTNTCMNLTRKVPNSANFSAGIIRIMPIYRAPFGRVSLEILKKLYSFVTFCGDSDAIIIIPILCPFLVKGLSCSKRDGCIACDDHLNKSSLIMVLRRYT